jgi:hypothetical protein
MVQNQNLTNAICMNDATRPNVAVPKHKNVSQKPIAGTLPQPHTKAG